jgi:hypothetical protein
MTEMVQAAIGAIALTGNKIQFKIAGVLFSQESLLKGRGQGFGMAAADESANDNLVAIFDQRYRLFDIYQFRFHANVSFPFCYQEMKFFMAAAK